MRSSNVKQLAKAGFTKTGSMWERVQRDATNQSNTHLFVIRSRVLAANPVFTLLNFSTNRVEASGFLWACIDRADVMQSVEHADDDDDE